MIPQTISENIRLNKFIANNTEFSRRKADELIKQGKVFINDKPAKELGISINPIQDQVKINGTSIHPRREKIVIALNKPAGFITTRNDELKRPTVMDLVPKGQNLKPIGRLDKDTEGLLLFSNDGEFINELTHPSFQHKKEYFVKIKGKLSQEEKEKLEKGIIIENNKTSPTKIFIKKTTNTYTMLTIEVHEGRKRQIRKMFAHFDHTVEYLQRIRIGSFPLGRIKKGQFHKLKQEEINACKSS